MSKDFQNSRNKPPLPLGLYGECSKHGEQAGPVPGNENVLEGEEAHVPGAKQRNFEKESVSRGTCR